MKKNTQDDTEGNIQFSEDAIDNFVELFDTLKRIHIRLISDGYTIKNDDIILPNKEVGK